MATALLLEYLYIYTVSLSMIGSTVLLLILPDVPLLLRVMLIVIVVSIFGTTSQ